MQKSATTTMNVSTDLKKEKESEPDDGKKINHYMLKKKTYVDYKGIEFEKEPHATKVYMK